MGERGPARADAGWFYPPGAGAGTGGAEEEWSGEERAAVLLHPRPAQKVVTPTKLSSSPTEPLGFWAAQAASDSTEAQREWTACRELPEGVPPAGAATG